MKILHIITRLDRGGSAEDLIQNCIYLHNKGYINKIVCGRNINPTYLLSELKSKNIPLINISCLNRNINLFFDLFAFLKILKLLFKEKPNIIHTRTSKAGIIGRWSAWLYKILFNKNVKIIHSTHGHVFYGYYNLFLSYLFILSEKITAYITDKIIVLTENEITECLKYGIGNKKKFQVIHSGVQYDIKLSGVSLRDQLNIKSDTLIIGSAGRLEPVKGYDFFIESAKILKDKYPDINIKYLIIGDGSQKEFLENKVKKYNLKNKFIFTGWKDNVLDYISVVDIYVQPSMNEGFGKTVILAQLLGKPVIATYVQGFISIIQNMKTGILVSSKNPLELAESIKYLIDNKNLREKLVFNAKKYVLEKNIQTNFYKFSTEYMNYLLEKLYTC